MLNVLIVNCLSHVYDRLCDSVCKSLGNANTSFKIIKRDYNQLKDILASELKDIDLVVFSGSSAFSNPALPEIADTAKLMQMALDKKKHGLAVCFGLQMLAYVLEQRNLVHVGSWAKDVEIQVMQNDPVLKGVSKSFVTKQYHNFAVPYKKFQTAKILAKSKDGIEIMRAGNMLATQFHPESAKASEDAVKVLENHLSMLSS
ncbi:hypothetical protein KY312_00840 [Candidatus Woesearchaeota archaeon]|nr:hypothetical protein [Candidatus Woesearchaeota archaeon]